MATNYKVRAYHNGDAEAMYGRFKEALADAIGDGLNITEYQGFANAEQFHREHWGRTGFSQQGAGTRSNYAKDLWARRSRLCVPSSQSHIMSSGVQASMR